MEGGTAQDSPLSITSSLLGILTFVVAIAAAIYARLTYLRNSDDEYFRIKTSLSWYKTESQWLADLLAALNARNDDGEVAMRSRRAEHQMYSFVMDDLLNLEQRLLDLVAEVEAKAAMRKHEKDSFTLVHRSWQGRPSVAMGWLSVRTKALELVRQREALTARVLFLQMSIISSRLDDLEWKSKWAESMAEGWKMNGIDGRGGGGSPGGGSQVDSGRASASLLNGFAGHDA